MAADCLRQSKFRLVAATNRDLPDMVRQGTFRADLYHRIAGATVALHPLRERRDDIPLLVGHFLRELRPERRAVAIDDRLLRLLGRMPLDGNIRQLRSIVQGLAAQIGGGDTGGAGHLPAEYLSSHFDRPNAVSIGRPTASPPRPTPSGHRRQQRVRPNGYESS